VDSKGKAKDTRTPMQSRALMNAVVAANKLYPKAHILGHRDFNNVAKDCPSFDVGLWLIEIGIMNPMI
jgi:N-acetylmuramoyl-L-alanine amidase